MAKALWADVFFQNQLAGILRQDPGGRVSFTYHDAYIAAQGKAIAHTLPVRQVPYYGTYGLPAYFDNLVAEGWLAQAQARALGTSPENRLALLIAFGMDCIGAVTIVDPEPLDAGVNLAWGDPDTTIALATRASLSGVQPKLTVIRDGKRYRPTSPGEISTHIAKLPSPSHTDLLENEFLTLTASRVMLKGDQVAKADLTTLGDRPALVIERFDRLVEGGLVRRLHFEEFNQVLGRSSLEKYEGAYEDMAQFLNASSGPLLVEIDRLFRRVLAAILLGNTDAHLKNFALFHTEAGYRLTPAYDLVAAALYPPYQTMALKMAGAKDLRVGEVKPKHLVGLANGFGLSTAALNLAVSDLGKALHRAQEAIEKAPHGSTILKTSLIEQMEKRWNGTFVPLGTYLGKRSSTKLGSGEKNNG
jgi:serine/threonine-protein kinase HipA